MAHGRDRCVFMTIPLSVLPELSRLGEEHLTAIQECECEFHTLVCGSTTEYADCLVRQTIDEDSTTAIEEALLLFSILHRQMSNHLNNILANDGCGKLWNKGHEIYLSWDHFICNLEDILGFAMGRLDDLRNGVTRYVGQDGVAVYQFRASEAETIHHISMCYNSAGSNLLKPASGRSYAGVATILNRIFDGVPEKGRAREGSSMEKLSNVPEG
ncbi:hypothetical protein IMY05_C4844000200 [Salix suchowensis]|nr:hypothetical protein IMY05_C4844000200 [Salix suchowensis]